MEKKGKNFGINEVRSFKFENGKLYQLSKTGDEKQLPLPQSVKK